MLILVMMNESHTLSTSLRKRRKRRHRITIQSTQNTISKAELVSHPERSVYLISRPVTKAQYLRVAGLSEGKFHLSHWSLLVSSHKEEALKEHIQNGSEDSNQSWGSLFEIVTVNKDIEVKYDARFGENLPPEWRYVSMIH